MSEVRNNSVFLVFKLILFIGGLGLVAIALGDSGVDLKIFIACVLFLIEFFFFILFYRLFAIRIPTLVIGGALAVLLCLQGRHFLLCLQNTGTNQKALNLLFVTFFQFISFILTAVPVVARGLQKQLLLFEGGLKGLGGKIYTLALFCWATIMLICSPLTVFTSSWQEIEVEALPLLAWLFLYFILFNAIGQLVFRLVPRELKVLAIWIVLFAAVMFWFYTYLLPGDFGHLDNFVFSKPDSLYASSSPRLLFEMAGLLAGLIFLIIFVQRFPKQILVFLTILNLMVFGQTVANAVSSGAFSVRAERIAGETEIPAYADDLLSFSKEQNVLVIMLDAFCGGFMPEILEKNPNLYQEYAGFIWYANALTTSNSTYGSIPAIVGGPHFSVEETDASDGKTIRDRYQEAFRFFPDFFHSQNYDVAFADPSYQDRDFTGLTGRNDITLGYSEDFIPYWEEHRNAEFRQDIAIPALEYSRIFSIVGLFKGSPFLLKPKIYYKGSWLRTNHGNIKIRHAVKELALLDVAPDLSNTDSPQKTFKFFSSEITHIPWPFNDEGRISKEFIRSNPQMIRDPGTGKMFDNPLLPYNAAVKALKVVARWFQWMKIEGIYDNTRIIIVADHGYSGINPMFEDFKVIRNGEGLILEGTGRIHPIFLIKDFNQKGPLIRSDHFVSNTDTPAFATKGIAKTDPLPDPLDIDSNNRELIMSLLLSTPGTKDEYAYRLREQFLVKDNIFEKENWRIIYTGQ